MAVEANYASENSNYIIPNNRVRHIEDYTFLKPTKLNHNTVKINNFQREEGIFLVLDNDLYNPYLKEKSLLTYGDLRTFRNSANTFENPRASSYYVALKKENPQQYGNLYDGIRYNLSDVIKIKNKNEALDSGYLFGKGDIYITKHRIIRKYPYFSNLPLKAPFDTAYITSLYPNVGFPRYYLDLKERVEFLNVVTKNSISRLFTTLGNSTFKNLNIGEESNLEPFIQPKKTTCGASNENKFKFFLTREGLYYTHQIGIVDYFCESEFVGDFRETNEIPQSNYKRDVADIIKYDTVTFPEVFLYNLQHLHKGIPSKYSFHNLDLDCCTKPTYDKNRVIFSLANDVFHKSDKWTKFKSRNYHQFEHQDGNLNAIIPINDYNLLFAFDNTTYSSQSDEGLLSNKGSIYLGQGSIFERKLRKISVDTNGLGGSIDYHSFVNTPYGVYWADRLRNQFIFFDGKSIKPIATDIKSFLNNFNDKPITGGYDVFSDTIYWSNGDWTVSYKPSLQTFLSFFDFIPERFIPTNNNILSVKNKSIWKHNTPNHYQTFYNETYPFEVAFTINNKFQDSILNNLVVISEFYKKGTFNSRIHTNEFFQKIAVYNDFTSTGLKFLEPHSDSSVFNLLSNITYTKNEFTTNINGFKNILGGQPSIEWDKDKYRLVNLRDVNEVTTITDIKNPARYDRKEISGTWYNVHFISGLTADTKKLISMQLNINS